jgi:hypothetical protein
MTKIRRPPNAYIIFASEWHRNLAEQYLEEGNKKISIRLGKMWQCLNFDENTKYFDLAWNIDQKHRQRYPGMV